MCGLVGVMGSLITEAQKKAFHDMLYLDVLRGEDSTGVAAISGLDKPKAEIEVFKSLGGPSDLFWEHNKGTRTRVLTYKPVNIYLGHNRYATQGKVVAENAHPFEFENVVGAHNGTVDMQSLRDFHGFKDFDVDSQIIYSHLSHTQDIEQVWKDADGALALTWYDKVARRLNIIRNSQRPLFVCYTEDDKSVFWASESWMILAAAYRNGIKLHDIIEVKPNRLYTFDFVKEGTFAERGRMYHTERDISPFVAKPIVRSYQQNYAQNFGRGGYSDDYWEWFDNQDKDKKEETKPVDTKKYNNFRITEFHDNIMAPSAVGNTEDGSLITINIPVAKYAEAKEKILGRAEKGYYFANKIHRSALNPENFWCNWNDCQWAKLKPDVAIKVNAKGGFIIEKQETKTEFAPWFTPEVYLTRAKFENLVESGCGCCDRPAKWEDRNNLLWVTREIYFCYNCKDTPLVKDIIQQHKSA